MYYSKDMFEDSFGPYTEESCTKGHHRHVRQYAEACSDFRKSDYHMQDPTLDDLAMDVLAAEKAGMSYGQWKARHPYTKWDYDAARTEAMLKNKEG
jgi:hypothetical protein